MLRICLLLFGLVGQTGATKPLPELQPFLAEVRKTLHTDSLLLSQYTFTEKRTQLYLDSEQKPKKTKVNVYEVFPGSVERVGYRRQIVKDGTPLTAAELKKEDEALRKRIESVQQKRDRMTSAERERARAERSREEEQILDDVFGLYEVQIVRRENLAEHPTILVNFNPRRTYKPKTRQGRYLQHIAGRAWISEEDHQLARIEAEIVEPLSIGFGVLAKLQKGAKVTSERRKFNGEIWLPVKTEVSLDARLFMLKGINIRQFVEYSDHKKYSVETILKFPDEVQPHEP